MSRLITMTAVLVLLGACAGSHGAPGRADAREPTVAHPAVDPAVECATCHADATPAVVAEWTRGPHGLALVKCFVCHGSTGADFAARPTTTRCAGCHAAEALTAAARNQNCFACHAPHALAARGASPHQGATP